MLVSLEELLSGSGRADRAKRKEKMVYRIAELLGEYGRILNIAGDHVKEKEVNSIIATMGTELLEN